MRSGDCRAYHFLEITYEVDLRDSNSRSMALHCIVNIVKFADRGNNYRIYGEEREICDRRAGFPYVAGGRGGVC